MITFEDRDNMTTEQQTQASNSIEQLVYKAHQNSVLHGFYENREFNLYEKLFLIVTELAELGERDREGKINEPDHHCPDFTNEEIEAADIFIRLADLAGYKKWRLGQAILAKMEYNASRPYKHGKQY